MPDRQTLLQKIISSGALKLNDTQKSLLTEGPMEDFVREYTLIVL